MGAPRRNEIATARGGNLRQSDAINRPPRLVLLIVVKPRLFSEGIFDQSVDPIDRQLVRHRGRHSPKLLDLPVEFDAFFTHRSHRICANQLAPGLNG